MKRLVSLLLTLVFSAVTMAQITITVDDLLDVGDSVSLAICDTVPAGFHPGQPGANLHWDFSGFVMDTSNILSFIDPDSTPYVASFPNSNVAVEGMVEGMGAEGWAYATKNMSVFQIDGFAGTYDIFEDVVAPFNPPEVMFDFPVNYLDSMVQTSTIDIRIESPEPPADSLRLKVVTTVETNVDAWGELITPAWTGNVLRIRDVRTTIDTVWVKLLFFWVYLESSTDISITYKYMANDLGYPAFQFSVDTSGTVFSGVNYLLDAGVGVTTIGRNGEVTLNVYPNPADDHINIRYSKSDIRYSKAGMRNTIVIYNGLGRKMDEINIQARQKESRVDVSDYPTGVYIAVFKNGIEKIGSTKFIVK